MDQRTMTKPDFIEKLLGSYSPTGDREIERMTREQEERDREARALVFWETVPRRYREVSFQGNPRLLKAQRSVIYGPYGTGKTYTGYAIARELYVSGRVNSFRIEREREIYNEILASQNHPERFRELYYDVDLLVIDEFGKSSGSDSSASHIFNIIDYRYDWELRTILICNAATPDELRLIVPEAVQDRFVGSTHKLDGKSRRVAE